MKRPWWLLYGVHELHCGISAYEKNTLASKFIWLVAWKRGLPRQNFHMKSYTHHPLYDIRLPKSQTEFFVAQKSLRFLKLLRVLIDRVVFRDLIDRILSRVLIDRVLFESSVKALFQGSINRFFPWSITTLFPLCRYSFIKSCYYFF